MDRYIYYYEVFQIESTEDSLAFGYAYRSLANLALNGRIVDPNNYRKVYANVFTCDKDISGVEICKSVRVLLRNVRPAELWAHSIDQSDIIRIHALAAAEPTLDDTRAFYLDAYGWTEVPHALMSALPAESSIDALTLNLRRIATALLDNVITPEG